MATTASNKKVARAASAGGGTSRRQTSTSWGYYGTLIGISVVGIALIVGSVIGARFDRKAPYVADKTRAVKLNAAVATAVKKHGATSKEAKAAQALYDDYIVNQHVHAAYSTWDCTKPKGQEFLPLINGENDPDNTGVHAHADGLIHIHPFVASVAGSKATLGKFFNTTGLNVTAKEIVLPAKLASADGKVAATKGRIIKTDTKCASGKKGTVKVFVFKSPKDTKPSEPLGKPKDIPLKANEVFVFALIEDGVTPRMPANATALESPSDVVSATPTSTVPANLAGVAPTTAPTTGGSAGGSTVAGPSTTKASAVTAPSTSLAK